MVDNVLSIGEDEISTAIAVDGSRNTLLGNKALLAPISGQPVLHPRWPVGIRFSQDGNFYGGNQMAADVPFDLGGTSQCDLGGNVGF